MQQNFVTSIAPALAQDAAAHFARRLTLETDCADVHAAMTDQSPTGFVLLDARGPVAFSHAHIPGALSMPHAQITPERMAEWPTETLFVVYCAGPHCNGADRAALRLAMLGRPVKLMLGGMTGWADEGFAFATV